MTLINRDKSRTQICQMTNLNEFFIGNYGDFSLGSRRRLCELRKHKEKMMFFLLHTKAVFMITL